LREKGVDVVDVARGEMVEAELDRLVEKRHDRRVADEGERPAEEIWMESERRYDERRRADNRAAWVAYHRGQAERLGCLLASLIAHHEAQVEKYTDQKGRAA
jgi:hypothetical protein